MGKKPSEQYKRLSNEYKMMLIQRLEDLGITVDKSMQKLQWQHLENILNIELGKRVRRAYDGEPCNFCGFVHLKRFSWSKCPKCKK